MERGGHGFAHPELLQAVFSALGGALVLVILQIKSSNPVGSLLCDM
jgi:hypothetical protein